MHTSSLPDPASPDKRPMQAGLATDYRPATVCSGSNRVFSPRPRACNAGLGGAFVRHSLVRKVDRLDPSYKT